LVVDDNETARDVLRAYLEDFFFDVTTVENGELAIRELVKAKAAEGKDYDLVLMDYQMPGMNGIEASRKIRSNLENIETPKIIMVTSFGREDIMKQADKVGLQGFLIKPVSPSMLFDTIMEVFGKGAGISGVKKRADERKPKGFEKILGARILLAEDNEINQQVAVETLEQEGFRVDVANNGKEVLEKLDAGYDLVLMDLQMPEMDGYEATSAIRKEEKYADLPIVAMTADAMTGVRERVIDEGMNDYVTKPIEPTQLWTALVHWIKPGERELPEGFREEVESGAGEPGELVIPEIEGIDAADGLNRVGGNRKLFLSLLGKFVRDFAGSAEEIRKCLEDGDAATAERLAHTVKGASGNIGAKILQKAATELDDVLKKGEGDEKLLAAYGKTLRSLVEAVEDGGIKVEEDTGAAGAGEELSPEKLKEYLKELEPQMKKRQPKKCAPILEEIMKYTLPEDYGSQVTEMSKLIKKYKFKEASAILETLLNRLGG
jgi:CheY-like chemotaxis protein